MIPAFMKWTQLQAETIHTYIYFNVCNQWNIILVISSHPMSWLHCRNWVSLWSAFSFFCLHMAFLYKECTVSCIRTFWSCVVWNWHGSSSKPTTDIRAKRHLAVVHHWLPTRASEASTKATAVHLRTAKSPRTKWLQTRIRHICS